MRDIRPELLDYLTAYFSSSWAGQFEFWIKGLIAFALIGGALWASSARRKAGSSLVALLGYLFPKRLYEDATARVTHWHYVLSVIVLGPKMALVGVSAFALAPSVRDALTATLGPRGAILDSASSIVIAQVATIFFSASFAFYWIHHAMHKVPLLWSFHRPHHSVEALTLPAVARTHPVESLLLIGVGCFAGLALGMVLYATGVRDIQPATIAIISAYLSWEVVTGIFHHSHVPLSFGWLDRIFVSPVLHQIHHSAELRHRDKNLSDWFRLSIWDWMFGTLYLPKRGLDDDYRWGLNDGEYGCNNPHLKVRDFYLEPFRHFFRVIRERL